MTKKSKTETKKSKVGMYTLDALCDIACEARFQAVLPKYLRTDRHDRFLEAYACMKKCVEWTAEFKRGKVSPILPVAGCENTFVSILSELPTVEHNAIQPDVEIDENGEDVDCGDYFIEAKDPKNMPLEKLEKLLFRNCCSLTSCITFYEPDLERRADYLAALEEYFRAAAAFAKRIKSDSCKLWLEALRLVICDRNGATLPVIIARRIVTIEHARFAYQTAEKAQAQLWVDVEESKLK